MPNTTKGTPYVQSSDLVSAYPTTSLSLANHIDNNLAYNAVTYNNQTGTTYTFVLADASTGRVTTASNAASQTYTVPPQTSVSWATGAVLRLVNIGAGAVTIAAGAGVTVSNATSTIAQWEAVEIIRTGSDTWVVVRGQTTPSAPGLAFITSSTFTSSTAVNLNNCFSSTYDSYRVMVDITAMSTTVDVLMRMRVSAADNTTTNYSRQTVYGNGTTPTADKTTGQTSWTVNSSNAANAENCKFLIDLFAPNLARRTIGNLHWVSLDSLGNLLAVVANISFTATTIFDGFSLVPSTGNFSGTVRVYGYRNS